MTPIPHAEPPGHPGTVTTWTLDSYDQLGLLRGALTAAVQRQGADVPRQDQGATGRRADVAAGLALAASELATNALKHAGPPATVSLWTAPEGYLLDVADCTPAAAPQRPEGRGPGEGGFGLALVTRVADSVGWYATQEAKHVWARFPAHETGLPTSG